MNKISKITAALILSFICRNSTAQMTGWTTQPIAEVVPDGEIVYLDENRVGVTNVSPSSSNYSILFNSGSLSGSFSNGDYCLLISMEDGVNAGFHKSCTIVGTPTGTSCTVTPTNPSGWGAFTSMSKIQLIKVTTVRSIALNYGQITCHAYDESKYTGGVLAFICDTFYVNAGYVNVSGQGISPYTMNYGTPGVGGPGSAMYLGNNNGRPQVNVPPCYTPDPITGKILFFTNNGTNGDGGLNNGGSGTTYSYSPTITNTTFNNNYPYRINMGRPGVLGSNFSAASGGGGGGHGGDGRFLNNLPISGDPGLNGENGNEPLQKNSRGGGIMIAKIGVLVGDSALITSNIGRFLSNGGYGSNGGHGGHAGDGGKGGLGELGYCDSSSIHFSGANGGYGDPGDPGNGGDATDGGRSGSIWYLSNQPQPVIGIGKSTTNTYLNPPAALFQVNGGKAGKGGVPGLGRKINHGATQPFDASNCSPLEWCVDTTITNICNCDTVFSRLNGKDGFDYLANLLGYVDFKYGSSIFQFDSTWGVLKYEQSSTLHYYCPMSNPTQFKDILKLMGTKRTTPYQNNPTANIEAVMKAGKLRVQVKSTKWPLAEYDFNSHTLTDLDDPSRKNVTETNCYYSYAAFGGASTMKVGNYGNDGSDYPYPGDKSIGNTPLDSNANVVFNSPAPGVEALGNKDVEIQKFKISPNPNVTSEICIESVEIIESIEILDGAGKLVMSLFPNKKQLNLDIDRLKPATYSIVCKSKNEIITRKFIKLNY